MFKWFWTIFSLGALDLSGDFLGEKKSFPGAFEKDLFKLPRSRIYFISSNKLNSFIAN